MALKKQLNPSGIKNSSVPELRARGTSVNNANGMLMNGNIAICHLMFVLDFVKYSIASVIGISRAKPATMQIIKQMKLPRKKAPGTYQKNFFGKSFNRSITKTTPALTRKPRMGPINTGPNPKYVFGWMTKTNKEAISQMINVEVAMALKAPFCATWPGVILLQNALIQDQILLKNCFIS